MFSKKAKGFVSVVAWHCALIGALVFWSMLGYLSYPLGAGVLVVALSPTDILALVFMAFFTLFCIITVTSLDATLIMRRRTLEDVGETKR